MVQKKPTRRGRFLILVINIIYYYMLFNKNHKSRMNLSAYFRLELSGPSIFLFQTLNCSFPDPQSPLLFYQEEISHI
jgi:nicotinamide riboside transporter PnuC